MLTTSGWSMISAVDRETRYTQGILTTDEQGAPHREQGAPHTNTGGTGGGLALVVVALGGVLLLVRGGVLVLDLALRSITSVIAIAAAWWAASAACRLASKIPRCTGPYFHCPCLAALDIGDALLGSAGACSAM